MLLIETASLISSKSQLQTPFWESGSSSSPPRCLHGSCAASCRRCSSKGPGAALILVLQHVALALETHSRFLSPRSEQCYCPSCWWMAQSQGSACSIPPSPRPPASINVQLCRGASPSVLGCRHLHRAPTGPWDLQHPWAPHAHRRCCSLRLLCPLRACVRRNYFEFFFKERRRKKNYQGKFMLGQS